MGIRYDMQSEASDAAEYLESLALKLEGWARDSLQDGWSTHQVNANREEATECRRRAERLRRSVMVVPR